MQFGFGLFFIFMRFIVGTIIKARPPKAIGIKNLPKRKYRMPIIITAPIAIPISSCPVSVFKNPIIKNTKKAPIITAIPTNKSEPKR